MGNRIDINAFNRSGAEIKGSTIFGVQYPPHLVNGRDFNPNSVEYKHYLPTFFAQQKHFSNEEYQEEVAKKFPKFKKKWYQKTISEKDIEQSFINTLGSAAMDGANSVPQVEEKLGIKVGGGYKYPKGMSDIEYHAYVLGQIGLYTPYREPNPQNQQEAFREAWQELHYPREKMLPVLQNIYKELVELNPQLKEIKLDTNDPVHLTLFRAGVTYNFPVADINLFISEHGNGRVSANNSERMKKELNAIGLDEKDFMWVLASETIKNIGERLKEKEGKDKADSKESVKSTEPQKSPKEQVIDKLKSWGIEEGTYMILTPDDNAYRSYGSNETRSIHTYFVEGKNDVKKTGADVVYGTNNGLEGAYFAEGVYVVACNDKLREMLYRKGKDTGLSVLLSNGEHFKKADGRVDDDLNNTWISAKDKAQKINQKMEKEAEERQAHVAKSAQNTSSQEKNGATCVAETFQSICDISDKLEPTGKLKNKIAQAYVQNNQELLSLEFWGNCAKQFADKCPAGKDTFVREVGKLGLAIGKDMKENADNPQYNAVKKRCTDDKDADSMLKTAQACAKRTTMGTDMHMDITASR